MTSNTYGMAAPINIVVLYDLGITIVTFYCRVLDKTIFI